MVRRVRGCRARSALPFLGAPSSQELSSHVLGQREAVRPGAQLLISRQKRRTASVGETPDDLENLVRVRHCERHEVLCADAAQRFGDRLEAPAVRSRFGGAQRRFRRKHGVERILRLRRDSSFRAALLGARCAPRCRPFRRGL
eukprot:scaffold3068_cov269-Pinguiococcus_pyrenoidosus.AAC.8